MNVKKQYEQTKQIIIKFNDTEMNEYKNLSDEIENKDDQKQT